MTVPSLKFYLAVLLIASICSSVLSNSRRSENGGKQRKEETPFWAARGKRAEIVGGVIRCGIVRPSPVESDSELSWPEIEPTGEDDLPGRVKRSAGSALKGEIEPVPLWLTRASMDMERPSYPQYFYPYSHNERLMNFLRQMQEKRADRGAEKNTANSESAPFWAPRG